MLSPEALGALLIAVASGALGAYVSERLHRRRTRLRAAQAERETEKRKTNVVFMGHEEIRQVVREEVKAEVVGAIVTNLRGLCGSVDKRMGAFEMRLESMRSLTVSSHENWMKDRTVLAESERARLEEGIAIRKALQAVNESVNRLLELLGA